MMRVKGSRKAIALTTDGDGRRCYLDPYAGGVAVVAEAARNLACVGAEPIAATDCLNFGSPENPEVMWQFIESVEGIGQACEVFATPITGGNVSFYNETNGAAILPTPILGIVGKLEDLKRRDMAANLEAAQSEIARLQAELEHKGGARS